MIPLLLLSLSLGADPLTLPQALAEARAVNATLPLARADVASAQARSREARAGFYPQLALDADVQIARPGTYSDSHALAKLSATATLFDFGKRRAEVRSALAELDAATAGLRKADSDLALEVRTRFAELNATDEELTARQDALERLRAYLTVLEGRRAGGAGVGADVLKTEARLAGDAADLEALRRDRSDAAHAFNDLLGRAPEEPLVLAPPVEMPLEAPPDRPWEGAPDVVQAKAELQSLEDQLASAQTERLPRLEARAEVGGVKPMFGSNLAANDVATAPGEGFGGAVGLTFTWPLWDFGATRARVDQANAAVEKARAQTDLANRAARLAWSQARSDAASLKRELALRTQAEPLAKDAYLSTEALYRGGVGAALDVLDAYGTWVDAAVKAITVRAALREAKARMLRWEGK